MTERSKAVTSDMLVGAFDAAQRAAAQRGRVYGYTGDKRRADPLTVPGLPGYMWVRIVQGGVVVSVQAVLNLVTPHRVDIAVWMSYNEDGILEVQGVVSTKVIERYGASAASMTIPDMDGRTRQDTYGGANFLPGRPRLVSIGTLIVTLEPFWYVDTAGNRKYWAGELSGTADLASHVPSASGGVNRVRWVELDFNPDATTPRLVASSGTAQFTTLPAPQVADIEDIPLVDAYLPVWAWRLTTGDTTLMEIGEDLRMHFGASTAADGGRVTIVSGDLSNPPTQVELETLLGDAAPALTGRQYQVEDSGNGRQYLVTSDGIRFEILPTVEGGASANITLTSAPDGGWTWFQDARALYASGKTFFVYVDGTSGAVEVRQYDHATATVSNAVALRTLGTDDHYAPAMLRRASDGKILIFYSSADQTKTYLRVSSSADDVTAFASEADITPSGGTLHFYHQPVELADGMYLVIADQVSGSNKRWTYSKSTDDGATWSARTSFYQVDGTGNPIYLKAVQNGDSRIDFVATDAHPSNGVSSIYHFYYEGGSFYRTDGTQITASLPFDHTSLTTVYNAATEGRRAWLWDIAIDPDTHSPVIVFASFVSTTDHRYMYARWTGTAWAVTEICTAGGYLYAAQPHYSGGVVLDHETPSVVYASRDDGSQFEMWRFTTTDQGATFTGEALTSSSSGKQMRPVAVRNHAPDLKVLWLSGTYTSYTSFSLGIMGSAAGPVATSIRSLSRNVTMRGTKANITAFGASSEEVAFAYATDTSELGVYTNGAWTWLGAGNVAADAIWDAKGDLAVGTGANTAQKLPVGTDGDVPIADSSQTVGIRWGQLAASDLASRYEPVTNGNPSSPELVFTGGDIVVAEVST